MREWRGYAALIGLLILTMVLTITTGKVSAVSEAGLAMSLPRQAGGWTGQAEAPSELERRGLPEDTEFERKRYYDVVGREIYCSIVLAGKHSQSIHRPETCLPSQGWNIMDAHYEQIPMAAGEPPLEVRALKILHPARSGDQSGGIERIVYYWFVGKDRLTASHLRRIFLTTYDRLMHNVNHRWAYITVTAVVPRAQTLSESATLEQQTHERMKEFVRSMFQSLKTSIRTTGSQG